MAIASAHPSSAAGVRRFWIRMLLIASACGPALPATGACDGDSKCGKAQQLVDLLGYRISIAELRESCVRELATLHPDRAIKRERDAFFGLTPAHPAWARLVAAFDAFTQEACGGVAFDEALLDRYRTGWQEHLTEEQLETALAFLQTEAGAPFAHGLLQTHRSVARLYDVASNKMRLEAFARFQQQAQQIASEGVILK